MPQKLLLFGPPRLATEGEETTPRDIPWQMPVAFLCHVALRPGWHSRDVLAESIRPDSGIAEGRAYVRRLLHRLRQIVPSLAGLTVESERVRWSGVTDVMEFERAVETRDWARAIRLQPAPLLDGTPSCGSDLLDRWFDEERRRLRRRLVTALMTAILDTHAAATEASALMEQLRQIDPMDEDMVQFLLSCARYDPEREVALRAYRALSDRSTAHSAPRLAASTMESFLRFQAGSPPAGRTAAAATAAARAIPLGRADDLDRLQSLVRDPQARLVTVLGFGGAGKSVLARSLFEGLAEEPGCTCAWIELATVTTANGLLTALMDGLGMQAREGPLREQIVRWLGTRRATLVLDNFEQLSAEAQVLTQLLEGAPGLRFVVTSREALGLAHERLFPLQGLGCEGQHSAAVELFLRHARRLGVEVAEADHAVVAELVAFLGGLPLGIELAADWVLLLPVDQILSTLKRDATFLDEARAGGTTLQGVFRSVWARLDSRAQDALVAAAHVSGPLNPATALAVLGASEPLLRELIDKSVLQQRPDQVLGIHPLVRELALRSATPRQHEDARSTHARHFLALLAEPPALRFGHHMPQRLAILLPYSADFSAAWRYAVDQGWWDLLKPAVNNLGGLSIMGARHGDALELSRYTLERRPPDPDVTHIMYAMRSLSAFRLGRVAEAAALATEGMAHQPRGAARAALHLVFARLNRYTDAGPEHALQALEAVPADDVDMRMWAQDELGFGLWSVHRLAEAESWISKNLELSAQQRAAFFQARSSALLGFVRQAQGRAAEALVLIEAGLAMFRRMGDIYTTAQALREESKAHGALNAPARQMEAARAALEAFEAGGYGYEVAESRIVLALAWEAQGDLASAERELQAALRTALAFRQRRRALQAIAWIGLLRAPAQGLELVAFALADPQLGSADATWIRTRLAGLGIAPERMRAAEQQASSLAYETVCGDLIAAAAGAEIRN